MPEVSEVQTLAEDVVDLTIKPEQPAEVEESASLALQQQPVAEEAVAEMTLEKAGEAPKLLVKPEPKVVEQGQTVVFECQATGEPAPEITWYREGVLVEKSERFQTELRTEVGQPYQSCLTVLTAEVADSGTYQLVVRNEFGESVVTVSLVVNDIRGWKKLVERRRI